MRNIRPEEIDAILPQTQCGLCGYGGCMPYAKALATEMAPINLCPPGGVDTLQQLGLLLNEDPAPFAAEMAAKAKPATTVKIREAECIGCVKCIKACPIDAIIGSAKQMHSVLTDICTGCELCIPACPIDCIEIETTRALPDPALSRERYQRRHERLNAIALEAAPTPPREDAASKRKAYLEAALLRARTKRS